MLCKCLQMSSVVDLGLNLRWGQRAAVREPKTLQPSVLCWIDWLINATKDFVNLGSINTIFIASSEGSQESHHAANLWGGVENLVCMTNSLIGCFYQMRTHSAQLFNTFATPYHVLGCILSFCSPVLIQNVVLSTCCPSFNFYNFILLPLGVVGRILDLTSEFFFFLFFSIV